MIFFPFISFSIYELAFTVKKSFPFPFYIYVFIRLFESE